MSGILRLMSLWLVTVALFGAETEYFSLNIPADWTTSAVDGRVKVLDGTGQERFTVEVNRKDNAFIMCFCAPWEQYEKFQVDGYEAARLKSPQFGVLTVKIRGKKHSVDVHYSYRKDAQDEQNVAAIQSIRPK